MVTSSNIRSEYEVEGSVTHDGGDDRRWTLQNMLARIGEDVKLFGNTTVAVY